MTNAIRIPLRLCSHRRRHVLIINPDPDDPDPASCRAAKP